jgi:enoyl-CoA hydratase/carnithine racemase
VSTAEAAVSSATEVLRERRGAALWLRLHRPQALNALTPAMVDALDAGLDEAAAPDVRAVVIAGSGRAFCAGADLAGVLARSASDSPDQTDQTEQPEQTDDTAAELGFLRRVGQVFDRVEALDKPVIAAVHGLALAGGLELVLCADFVVAARSAGFGDAHATYGLLPGAGASVRLPRRVGPSRAKWLMVTGATVTAERLAHTDLITELVEDDELPDAVDALVAAIGSSSAVGVRAMKQLVADAAETPTGVALRNEQLRLALHTHTADYREGLRAFVEKRRPRFVGR